MTEVVAKGEIRLKKIVIEDTSADMLTKMVNASKFEHCLDLVHLK